MIPSQFAVFFANEIVPEAVVIELGSGNGRDAMFLGKCVHHVMAVDGSEAGIISCVAEAKRQGSKNIDFIHSLIDDIELIKIIENRLSEICDDAPIFIYSRFFLHSINEQDEDHLVQLIGKLMENRHGKVFIEFRTKEDEKLSKYTGTHYRRYVDSKNLITKFSRLGYEVNYHVEGIGFAKYKIDDAYVARLVFGRL